MSVREDLLKRLVYAETETDEDTYARSLERGELIPHMGLHHLPPFASPGHLGVFDMVYRIHSEKDWGWFYDSFIRIETWSLRVGYSLLLTFSWWLSPYHYTFFSLLGYAGKLAFLALVARSPLQVFYFPVAFYIGVSTIDKAKNSMRRIIYQVDLIQEETERMCGVDGKYLTKEQLVTRVFARAQASFDVGRASPLIDQEFCGIKADPCSDCSIIKLSSPKVVCDVCSACGVSECDFDDISCINHRVAYFPGSEDEIVIEDMIFPTPPEITETSPNDGWGRDEVQDYWNDVQQCIEDVMCGADHYVNEDAIAYAQCAILSKLEDIQYPTVTDIASYNAVAQLSDAVYRSAWEKLVDIATKLDVPDAGLDALISCVRLWTRHQRATRRMFDYYVEPSYAGFDVGVNVPVERAKAQMFGDIGSFFAAGRSVNELTDQARDFLNQTDELSSTLREAINKTQSNIEGIADLIKLLLLSVAAIYCVRKYKNSSAFENLIHLAGFLGLTTVAFKEPLRELYAQATAQSATNGVWVLLATWLAVYFSVDRDTFRSEKFYSIFGRASSAGDSMEAVFTAGLDLIQSVINYVLHDCLGYAPYRFATSGHARVEKWFRSVCEYVARPLGAKRDSLRMCNVLRESGKNLQAEMISAKATYHHVIKDGLRMLDTRSIEEGFGFMSDDAAQVSRMRPVAIMLRGKPGIGKTTMTNVLLGDMLASVLPPYRTHELEDVGSLIYSKARGSKYWEGYIGQDCIKFEDFMQERDQAGDKEGSILDFMDLCGTDPVYLNMATQELKGKIAACPSVLACTSNRKELNPQAIHEPDALRRRFDLAFEVEVQEKYSKKSSNGKVNIPDSAKTGGINFDIYEFHAVDMLQDGNRTGECYSWDEVVELFSAKYFQYLDEYNQTYAIVDSRMKKRVAVAQSRLERNGVLEDLLARVHPDRRGYVLQFVNSQKIPTTTIMNAVKNIQPFVDGQTAAEWMSSNPPLHVLFEDMLEDAMTEVKLELNNSPAVKDVTKMAQYTKYAAWGGVVAMLCAVFSFVQTLYRTSSATAESFQGDNHRVPVGRAQALVTMEEAAKAQSNYGVKDDNAMALLTRVKDKNLYRIGFQDQTGIRIVGAALALEGNTFLICHHFKELFEHLLNDLEHTHCTFTRVNEKPVIVHVRKALDSWRKIKNTCDGATITLDEFKTSAHKNIVAQFVTRKAIPFSGGFHVALWDPKDGKEGMAKFSAAQVATNPCRTASLNSSFYLRERVTFGMYTSNGTCGGPVIAFNNHINPGKILGIHTAGQGGGPESASTTQGMAEIITVEALQAHLGEHASAQSLSRAELEDLGFPVLGEVEKVTTVPTSTKKRRSALWTPAAKTRPAHLRPFINSEGVEVDPVAVAMAKLRPRERVIQRDEARAGARYAVARTLHTNPKILTFEQAILGDPLLELEPINRHTSAGYPLNLMPGADGKKHILGYGEIDFTTKEMVFLRQQTMDTIALMESDISDQELAVLLPVQDCLKDERRPHAKVEKGSTRMFNVAPLVLTIISRMYYGSYFACARAQKIRNGSAVGVNPASPEWSDIHDHVTPGPEWKVGDGDHEKFDASQDATLGEELHDAVSDTYGLDCSGRRVRMRLKYIYNNSVHLCGTLLVQNDHTLPSGLDCTTHWNVLYNDALHKIVWDRLCAKHGIGMLDREEFWRIMCFGDDVLSGRHEKVSKLLTSEFIAEEMARLGHKMTNSAKTGPPEFTEWDNVTFLKRGFVYSERFKQWMAPLDKDVVKEMTMWYTAGPHQREIMRSNVDVSLLEMALHGEEEFDKWYNEVVPKCVQEYGYQPVYPSYSDAIKTVLVTRSEFDHNPISIAVAQADGNVGTAVEISSGMDVHCEDGTNEQSSTTKLSNEACVTEVTTVMPPMRMNLRVGSDGVYQDIKSFLEKPQIMAQYSWTTGYSLGNELGSFSPQILLLSTNPLTVNKLDGILGFRGDIVLRWQVNGQRFQVGLLLGYVYPGWDSNRLISIKRSLCLMTQLPHCTLNLGSQTEMVLRIPFYHNGPFLQLKGGLNGGTSFYNMLVNTVCYSPLVAPSGDANAEVTVWANYENVELIGAAGSNAWYAQAGGQGVGKASGSAHGDVKASTIVGRVGKTLALFGGVPVIGNALQGASWLSETAANALSLWGFSNPRNRESNTPVTPAPYRFTTNADYVNTSTSLSVLAQNEVVHYPTASITSLDEMSLDFICGRWAYFTSFNWSDGHGVGTQLYSGSNAPTLFNTAGFIGAIPTIYPTPFNYVMTCLFNYWHADIEIRMRLVKNEFHSGRLAISVFPRDTGLSGPSTTVLTDTAYVNRVIYDIRDSDEFIFTIPYMSEKPLTYSIHGTTFWTIHVLNQLRAPATTAQNINVMLEMRVKPGALYAQAINTSVYAPAVAQADTNVGAAVMIPDAIKEIAPYTVGEVIYSVRSLLKMLDRFITSDTLSEMPSSATSMQVFPQSWETAYSDGTTIRGTRFAGTRWSAIHAMFGSWRGGIVLRTNGITADVAAHMEKPVGISAASGGCAFYGATCYGSAVTYAPATVNSSAEFTVPYQHLWYNQPNIPTYNNAATTGPFASAYAMSTGTNSFADVYAQPVSIEVGPSYDFATATYIRHMPNVLRAAGDDYELSWFLGAPQMVPLTSEPTINLINANV